HLDSNPNGEKILVKTHRRKFSRLFLDGAIAEQASLIPKRPSSPSKRPQKSATVSLLGVPPKELKKTGLRELGLPQPRHCVFPDRDKAMLIYVDFGMRFAAFSMR